MFKQQIRTKSAGSSAIHNLQHLFPLKSARDVVTLFQRQLDNNEDDDDSLALLSIVLGLVEGQLTANGASWTPKYVIGEDDEVDFALPVPIPLKRTRLFLDQFKALIRGSVDLSAIPKDDTESLVTRTADILWTLLAPSNTHSSSSSTSIHCSESAEQVGGSLSVGGHLQFLSSFLLDKKLDAFGLTFAVLSALQILVPSSLARTIFLTLSEDHSWISVLGANSDETASLADRVKRVEVTWHGKVDKRYNHNNNNIVIGAKMADMYSYSSSYHHSTHSTHNHHVVSGARKDNWLYLGERNALICDSIHVTLATLVSSLNSAISLTSDSIPLALIKRQLLSLFHARGHLSRYPMALGNLADLIEVIHPELVLPTASARLEPPLHAQVLTLYHEAISSALTHYSDGHIYPYLYLAGFYVRCGDWSRALSTWSRAARVVSRYNYVVKEDEEAYKEFQEIATDLIPFGLRQLHEQGSNEDVEGWKRETGLRASHYRDLVGFYDGICGWEESSRCPILHIVWAKALITCLNKFHPKILSSVRVEVEEQKDEEQEPETVDIRDLVSKCSSDPTFLLKSAEGGEDAPKQEEEEEEETRITLRSAKMGEMAPLFMLSSTSRCTKLNTSAIQLQLTAQSSLLSDRDHHVRGSGGVRARSSSIGSDGARMRTRRVSGSKRMKIEEEDDEELV